MNDKKMLDSEKKLFLKQIMEQTYNQLISRKCTIIIVRELEKGV